jgi:hypothetical protein
VDSLARVNALITALREGKNSAMLREQYEDVVKTIPYIDVHRSKWDEIDRLKNDKLLMPTEKTPFNYFKS